jgi:hypothetical protein
MSNGTNTDLQKQQLGELVDNNAVCAYAVRGVGPAGLDLVCQTVAAIGPGHALTHVMDAYRLRRGPEVVCWVVTNLRKA